MNECFHVQGHDQLRVEICNCGNSIMMWMHHKCKISLNLILLLNEVKLFSKNSGCLCLFSLLHKLFDCRARIFHAQTWIILLVHLHRMDTTHSTKSQHTQVTIFYKISNEKSLCALELTICVLFLFPSPQILHSRNSK